MKKTRHLLLFFISTVIGHMAYPLKPVTHPCSTTILGQQLYRVVHQLASADGQETQDGLVMRLRQNGDFLKVIEDAEIMGIKRWQVINVACNIAQQCDGSQAHTTKILISCRNKEWDYWFDTYTPLLYAAAVSLVGYAFYTRIRQSGGHNNTTMDADANRGNGIAYNPPITDRTLSTIPRALEHQARPIRKFNALPYLPMGIPQVQIPLYHAMPTVPQKIVSIILPKRLQLKREPLKLLTYPEPQETPKQPQITGYNKILLEIANQDTYTPIWQEVTIEEKYKPIVVAYSINQVNMQQPLTLAAAAQDKNKKTARLLVWSAIADQYQLKLEGDLFSRAPYWFWSKDPEMPLLKGERILNDEMGSVTFKDFHKARGEAEQRRLLRILTAEYKIHLMPIGDPSTLFIKLFDLIAKTPHLQNDIWAIKVHSTYDDDQIKNATSGSQAVRPKIVIYPATGKEPAQRVFSTIFTHFKHDPGLGVAPRYNQRITDLIYIAQGNGDDKVGNNLDFFQAPDYVYFNNNTVAQELSVDPASLQFELIVPAT